MKPLDMADKYDPLSYQDDEPDTIRMNTNPIFSQVVVSEDEEPTLPSMRNPLLQQEEKRYPGVGLLIAFGTGILFWGAVAWLIWG